MRVVVERLGKTYHDRQGRDVVALRQVDFAVETREFVALLGPSGCGKSTLLGIIAGLLPATSGRVYFEGEPRPGQAPVTATVFQEFALFPWRTVRANVEFGLEELGIVGAERAERTRRYLDMSGLVGFEGVNLRQQLLGPEMPHEDGVLGTRGLAGPAPLAHRLLYLHPLLDASIRLVLHQPNGVERAGVHTIGAAVAILSHHMGNRGFQLDGVAR